MSREITIPGGTAVLRESHELTERHRRPIKMIVAQLGPNAQEKMLGWQAGTYDLTEHDAELMFKNHDAVIWCYLKSWSLDRPVPDDWREVGNSIPGDVYDALMAACMEQDQATAEAADSFGVDGVEDEQSPTGPSAA